MIRIFLLITIVVGVVAVLLSYGVLDSYIVKLLKYTPAHINKYVSNVLKLKSNSKSTGRLITKEELKGYTGEKGKPVYLSILGQVFDVTKGKKHYGIGGGYEFFAGRDGTRAFVSGDFTEAGLVEDVKGLSNDNLLGIEDWLSFYHKDYKYVGKLIGHFYDDNGNPTQACRGYRKQLKQAKKEKEKKNEDLKMFPSCNSESAQGKGRRVWCSNRSGGIQRNWVGLPRQYYKPGMHSPRCACVKNIGAPSLPLKNSDEPHKNNGDLDNPHMKVYDGCDLHSVSCSFPEGQ